MKDTGKAPGLASALEVWGRRKQLVLIVFATVLTIVVSTAVSLPDIYEATATILVESQQVPESFVQPTVTSRVERRLQTITQQILSYAQLQQLIQRFDLYPDQGGHGSMTERVSRMRRAIRLEQQGGQERRRSGMITAFMISYRGNHPQQVAQVTNTLASLYIEENLKDREQQATGTAEFLEAQLGHVGQRLALQEQRLSEFKERSMGELPQQLHANLATLERLNTQLRLNSDKQARVNEQRTSLLSQLEEAKQLGVMNSPAATNQQDTPAARLSSLKQQLAMLRTRYYNTYPDVQRLLSEIAGLEQQLAGQPEATEATQLTAPLNPYVQQLQDALRTVHSEIHSLKVEEHNLLASIALYQQRVENTPRREQEQQTLMRDYETTQELYRSLLKRQEEARLAESMEQRQKGEQFRLLEPATPPAQPAAPNRARLCLIGFVLALGLAVGLVVLVEQWDTSFHTVDELRAFSSLPILARLPRIVTTADARRVRRRATLATVSAVVALGIIGGTTSIAAKGNVQLMEWLVQSRLLGH